ncbi:MAG TPA: alpha-isopropylmalate synthase regulatory domain-containing protein, partial [Ramlibacter sp.]
LPRRLQIEFSQVVQGVMDASGKELTARELHALFEREYGVGSIAAPDHQLVQQAGGVRLQAEVQVGGRTLAIQGSGNGPIDAFVDGLSAALGDTVRVLDYHEHAIGAGANAQAVAYLELRVGARTLFGVGMDANIVSASLKAILSGLQRAHAVARPQSATVPAK